MRHPLLNNNLLRISFNFVVAKIRLVFNKPVKCLKSDVLKGVPCPILPSHPIGMEVATEKINLEPLAGRLVVLLSMKGSLFFFIGGDSCLMGGVVGIIHIIYLYIYIIYIYIYIQIVLGCLLQWMQR